MSYVILNFEDANPDYQPGVKVKGFKGKNPRHAGGAAGGTLLVYRKRAKRKSKIYNKKEVAYFSCQELLERDKLGLLTKAEVNEIRQKCAKAKTIAFIIHGTHSDTEKGFSTDGRSLCTWTQLAHLGQLLLPDTGKTYNVALIMCYAARMGDHKLNHQGEVDREQLKTSFAYKFFRALALTRSVRMSARTGAVSNDGALNHTVESEDMVLLAIQRAENNRDRTLNKTEMERRRDELINTGRWTRDTFYAKMLEFVENPRKVPANDDERFILSFAPYSSQAGNFLTNQYQRDRLSPKAKYGKFIYTYEGGTLTITNRYGDPDDPNIGQNHILYEGGLLW